MSIGFDVCVIKEGAWVIYAFFEESEKSDALHTAKDIQNNYRSVCVLWSERMSVIYYHSKDSTPTPSYLEIRSDIKLAKETRLKNRIKANRRKPKVEVELPERAEVPVNTPKVEDEFYTQEDKKQTALNTLIILFACLLVTIAVPFVFKDFSGSLKLILIVISLIMSIAVTLGTHYLSETTARERNKRKSLDSKEVWEDIKKSPFKETLDSYDEAIKAEESKQNTNEAANDTPAEIENNIAPQTAPEEDSSSEKNHIHTPKPVALTDGFISSLSDDTKEAHVFDDKPEEENHLTEETEKHIKEFTDNLIAHINEYYTDEEDTVLPEKAYPIMLYISGAVARIIENADEESNQMYVQTDRIMTRLYISPETTEDWLSTLKEDLNYPSCAGVYRHGENDALRYLNTQEMQQEFDLAMKFWDETSSKSSEEEGLETTFQAIIFTDIVNFTENTRIKGEIWMKDVIRAHNDILRKILSECHGVEVKHTGDGILATFESVFNASEAALLMQESLVSFNRRLPDRAFEVRIGISCGQILNMDNDIFGEAVNLAARIMQHCNGNETIISENVQSIISEKESYQTTIIENVELKGFEAQSLYYLTRLQK